MSRSGPLIQELAECRERSLVGGKAINLGNLIRAGFSVPGGFVVTTAAYRGAHGQGMGGVLAEEIRAAYRRMGSPTVAVRSSATAEDLSDASMAGQYETFLDVTGEDGLLEAVRSCWASLDSPRTRSYLAEHGIEMCGVAMAVVVQGLVPAEVAGVLFCANPRTGSRREMLIEASWGLGESVVSGRVQPDVLRVDRETGRVIEARVADKQVYLKAGDHGERPVEEALRKEPCLCSADVTKLWELGRRAEDHFGSPQDIEWAIHDGQLYLLQSRPITTLAAAEAYEQILQTARQRLRERLEKGQGPWVLHNIAETLPHATPLTWSVIKRFMSGAGGFGAMYRQAGFEPSAKVSAEGFLERIAGRAYMDLALAGEMFFGGYPFRYDVGLLRSNPDASQSPPTVGEGSLWARARVGRRIGRINRRLHETARDLDRKLTEEVFPEFAAWCKEEKERDLARLPAAELVDLWHRRERKVMDEFGPQSLLPSLIAGMALAELRAFLNEQFWDDDPDELAGMLSSAHRPDKTMLGNAQLREMARGQCTLEQWLAEHGHRGPAEFDLATPRWREQREEVVTMADRLKDGADPLELHGQRGAKTEAKLAELRAGLSRRDQEELGRKVDLARRYLPFREDGKHYLMLGYDLLRDVGLEAGRRLGIGEDVFQLNLEELLDALRVGFAPLHVIGQRRVQHEAEGRVVLPQVIDQGELEGLGEMRKVEAAGSHAAFAVSSGVATGPARIVRSPQGAGDLGKGYILVCPSTDPGWTPLFVNAAGLILECGGTLSHGAVIAREMSIPAVVLPGATALFADWEMVCVDGRNGVVRREATEARSDEAAKGAEANNVRIPRELVPPVAGRKERFIAKVRNMSALVWGVYLVGVYVLPEEWVSRPSLAVMDWLLWPLVRAVGKVWTTAIVAAGLAALTMMCQRWLTDNARLVEAKRRAVLLNREAARLPRSSKRCWAMEDLAGGVQMRVALAGFVPLAVLLGPLVMSCVWLPARVDVAAWNAPPGSVMNVVAKLNSDVREAVTLEVSGPLHVDESTPATRVLEPIRETLERLGAQWQQPSDLAAQPWELQEAARMAREGLLADLRGYLKAGVPAQSISWQVRSEEEVAGRFAVRLMLGGKETAKLWAVLGDQYPPQVTETAGGRGSPVVSLKLVYNRPDQKRVFWAPLAWLGKPHWEVGWIITYLLAYLPPMFIFRRVLRVA